MLRGHRSVELHAVTSLLTEKGIQTRLVSTIYKVNKNTTTNIPVGGQRTDEIKCAAGIRNV